MKKHASYFYCSCYYTHNIYIKAINKHFTFINKNQFFKDYREFLTNMGYKETEKESLVAEIIEEINRRKLVQENTLHRRRHVESNYVPLDTSVFQLKEEFLEPSFIKLVEAARNSKGQEVFEYVDKLSVDKKIYGFPVFKPDFCARFLKELQHFEESDIPRERPNTMNNYGILIDDIGFHDNFSMILRTQYLDPISKVLFPEWRGQGLDSHKVFTIGYKFGQDKDLGYHYDNSEVTSNICLGKKFEGSELYFGNMNTIPIAESTCFLVPHKIGYGILHRGQQYHGALSVTSGERQNLIMWMRSSSIRNYLCPMCYSTPSLVPSADYGDGFTKHEDVMLCKLL